MNQKILEDFISFMKFKNIDNIDEAIIVFKQALEFDEDFIELSKTYCYEDMYFADTKDDFDWIWSYKVNIKSDITSTMYSLSIEWVDDDLGNYCECERDYDDYNSEYECCGVNCDWSRPTLDLRKMICLSNYKFIGRQKDLWKLKDDILDDIRGLESKKLKEKKNKLILEISKLQRELEDMEDDRI